MSEYELSGTPISQEGEDFLATQRLINVDWKTKFIEGLRTGNIKLQIGAVMVTNYINDLLEERAVADEIYNTHIRGTYCVKRAFNNDHLFRPKDFGN